MEIALISDIHGNLVSLDAVLRDISRRGIESVVCLGDVAATGPRPVECIERIRGLSCPVVMGNTDERFLRGGKARGKAGGKEVHMLEKMDEWTSAQLTREHLAFLSSFRSTVAIDLGLGRSMLCFHGSPHSNTDLLTASSDEEKFARLFPRPLEHVLYAGGHTHAQMYRRLGHASLINPGSVGLPFVTLDDGRAVNVPRGEYAVVEADEGGVRVSFHAVSVEIDKITSDALSSGMPYSDVWAADWQDTGRKQSLEKN